MAGKINWYRVVIKIIVCWINLFSQLISQQEFDIQVKWAEDNLDGYLNFYSISGDGRVSNWTIVKTSLWYTDALNISFCRQLTNFPDIQAKNALRGIFIFMMLQRYRITDLKYQNA